MEIRTAWWLAIIVTLTLSEVMGNDVEEGEDGRKEVTRQVPEVEDDGDLARFGEFLDEFFGGASQDTNVGEGRTFAIKRLQFMLLPVMYKMGVMTTMLAVLTVVSLKTLLIGVILLVIKLGSFLAKFHGGWQPQADHGHGWSPPQPIHVHVHNDGSQKHYGQAQSYSAWESPGGPYGSGPYGSGPGDDEHYYYKG